MTPPRDRPTSGRTARPPHPPTRRVALGGRALAFGASGTTRAGELTAADSQRPETRRLQRALGLAAAVLFAAAAVWEGARGAWLAALEAGGLAVVFGALTRVAGSAAKLRRASRARDQERPGRPA